MTVLAVIAEYLIPGSVLASAPLFVGITLVAFLCLLAPIPEGISPSPGKRYARWKWLMPSLCLTGVVGLVVRDQDHWTWIMISLCLFVFLAVVWTIAYDEKVDELPYA